MDNDIKISGLAELGSFLHQYLKNPAIDEDFSLLLKRSEVENPWFTQANLRINLQYWADILTEENIRNWVGKYQISQLTKRVGLILAGNIPLVGFHDVMSVILSNHIPIIKLSSKDKVLLPFLLKKWKEFSQEKIEYELVDKLENYDAVIATGSNNTARYLEYYFKNHLNIIRKNRTSVAILKGDETDDELNLLADDMFTYFGLGCRNVTRLFIPQDFPLERLFENFLKYKDIINHHKYANNYDYNRAVYLLNQDLFWDNNFVMLKEDEKLFSPLSVINFSRYNNITEVEKTIAENKDDIQCIVAKPELGFDSILFGEAQYPSLDTYADNVDTMQFLSLV